MKEGNWGKDLSYTMYRLHPHFAQNLFGKKVFAVIVNTVLLCTVLFLFLYVCKLTIGSYIGVHSSRYEALGKFGEHERCARVI